MFRFQDYHQGATISLLKSLLKLVTDLIRFVYRVLWQHVLLSKVMLCRVPDYIPTVWHSQQHNITQQDMLPKHPVYKTESVTNFNGDISEGTVAP